MEEANRLCKDLGTVYWACMEETKKAAMSGYLDNKCTDSFDDYSFCVKEVMRQKVERQRAAKK